MHVNHNDPSQVTCDTHWTMCVWLIKKAGKQMTMETRSFSVVMKKVKPIKTKAEKLTLQHKVLTRIRWKSSARCCWTWYSWLRPRVPVVRRPVHHRTRSTPAGRRLDRRSAAATESREECTTDRTPSHGAPVMSTDNKTSTVAVTTVRRLPLLQPFNGLFSRTTWVNRYQKGKTSLDLNKARADRVLGWQWHQLDHMQTICTSHWTDNQINTSSLNFYRLDASHDAQITVSKHWRQIWQYEEWYGNGAGDISEKN